MTDSDGFELLRNNLMTLGLIEATTSTREVVELCMSFIIGNQEPPVKPRPLDPMSKLLKDEMVRLANDNRFQKKHEDIRRLFT